MAGIRLPDEERLPPGPHRNLVIALHDIYEMAGKPAARTISTHIRERDDLPGTLSHEGVSAVLRGVAVPRWRNLESLVRVLVEHQRVGQQSVTTVVVKIHTLWRLADGGYIPSNSHSPDPESTRDFSLSEVDEESVISEEGEEKEAADPSALAPVMRWNPRRRTLDVFDRQVAVEIFKEVGGVDE
ncbi:hypothetical protein [Streptomyces massasporeus]|uniref:hypothetical protein n=1 Tax=Streptomyces massasporeus TaxID=67324 RepID=UPI00371230FF